ncbi:MAG TPA: sigma-70 family RNA polymerase sigma factor [Mucilaginibacter sp.]
MAAALDLTDDELTLRLKAGDRTAFALIYRKYWPDVYNALYKKSRDKEQCQDIVQNVFTDLWIRREQLAIVNLPAYLHSAARFQFYKRVSREPQKALYLDTFDEIIWSPVSADDHLRETEILQLVELWLAALPEKRRTIFLLYYREELSTRKIAEQLGISQKTVQSQLYTATQSLRSRLAHFLSLAALAVLIGHS